MKKGIIVTIGLVVVAIAIYLFVVSGEDTPKQIEVEDIKELVNDYTVRKITNQSASITSDRLIVTDSDENQVSYGLPEDELFVSIAPYIETTHPCAIHSLTGCQGELIGQEVDVYIKDSEGNVIVDKTLKTQENGFIDLWMPRDKNYQVTITQDGKSTQSKFSTFKDDNTCITTMKLV